MRTLKTNLISSLIFGLTIVLSKQFSLFYEMQPVIWPASAVLPVVAMVYGKRALFGPLLTNFIFIIIEVHYSVNTLNIGISMAVAFVITAMNYVRAIAVLFLMKRYIGIERSHLYSPDLMLKFLILLGPVAGLMDCVIMLPAAMTLPGISIAEHIILSFQVWIAMSTGGAIFAPILILLLMKKVDDPTPRRVFLISSAFALTMFLALLWFIRYEISAEVTRFDNNVSYHIEESLLDHFSEIEDLNHSIIAAINLDANLTETEFDTFTHQIVDVKPDLIDVVAWSPLVSEQEKSAFEAQMNCKMNIHPVSHLQTTNEIQFLPVKYLFPMDIANEYKCLDLLSEQRIDRTVRRAITSRATTLSRPVTIDEDNTNGILLFTPVLDKDQTITGVVAAVIVVENLIESTFSHIENSNIRMSFSILDDDKNEQSVYQQQAGSDHILDHEIRQFDMAVFDQTWRFKWQPYTSEIRKIYGWQINFFSTLGAIFVLLIQFIAYRLAILNQTIRLEVSRKTQQLEFAKKIAEDASETKSRFLANMSHEIRTPLNAILGFAELAKAEKKETTLQQYLSGIWSSSEALLGLVNDVLDYSKIEAGKLQLSPTQFSIENIAHRLEAIFSIQANSKQLDFSLNYDRDIDYDLYGDDARIQQILINLCSNAIKFTHDGHVTVNLKIQPTDDTNISLIATISDSGIGMSEDVQLNIFEEFTQADSAISRKYGGTGLGLAISYTLANLLNGELLVQSEPDEGTTFTLSVPLQKKSKKPQWVVTPAKKFRYNILLVDDNAVNLTVTAALLKKSGFNVTTESSGVDAIASVLNFKPDLVLMDMQMPDMDGLETTERLRQTFSANALTIVGLTANAAAEDRRACLNAGMNDHLAKPISMEKLSICLTTWLT